MNFIVFDLEFNQNFKSVKDVECPFEIIQIGAVKLDSKFNMVGTFSKLIKPQIYTTLHPYVKEITGLTMEQLNSASPFKNIYEQLTEFIGNKKSTLCVWGTADIKELFRNILYYDLDYHSIPESFINVQSYASEYANCPKGTNIGLRNASEFFNIPITYQFHDALNDAYYTSEVFKRIYNKNIVINTYDLDKLLAAKQSIRRKNSVDNKALIKQFEKMFKRKMTDDEKSIIKLAYLMGKSNQFQIVQEDDTKV